MRRKKEKYGKRKARRQKRIKDRKTAIERKNSKKNTDELSIS